MSFEQYLMSEGRRKIIYTVDSDFDGIVVKEVFMGIYDKYGVGSFTTSNFKKDFPKVPSVIFAKIRKVLIELGYMEVVGTRKFEITARGEAFVSKDNNSNSQDSEVTLSKGVKDISKLKAKKFIVPKVGRNSKYLEQMKTLLTHMDGFAKGSVKTSYMLAGDPGSGKTSFIRSLSTLTGVPLVVIEAPHVTQEHLINIPFLVIVGKKTIKGNVTVDNSDFKVVQAESNLVTQIKRFQNRDEALIQKEINRSKVLREIQPLVKRRLDKVKGAFNSILFIDEYYRTSSVKIRNVLRNILNGKIGNDKIPKGTYVIMATNIDDDGIDEIQLNQDFHMMNYDVSSKEDFMAYMYSKHVTNPEEEEGDVSTSGVSINVDVWNKFMDELTDDDLGFNDAAADVRLSPRRLEQLILYVDAVLPISDEKEAINLMSFIKTNFTNYMSDESSQLIDKFRKIVSDLILESSPDIDIDFIKESPSIASDWRSQLQQQIETKIKLGDSRSYVPVVSGHPGIGKTSQMVSMSNDMGMGFIQIDTSNLTVDATVGLPISSTAPDGTITTEFSKPPLYLTIMKEYDEIIESVKIEGRKYNVVLLFDELNRADVAVFNAIRKVLLEKDFGTVKLPDDVIITGAINPHDSGTTEFTSHTRDVLDIIPSSGNFSNTIKYINSKSEFLELDEEIGFGLTVGEANLLSSLSNTFKSSKDSSENIIDDAEVRPFWWNGGDGVFYVSPREMTELVGNVINQTVANLLDMNYIDAETYSEEEYELFIDECVLSASKAYSDTFNNITNKQEILDFTITLASKISNDKNIRKYFESIRTSNAANSLRLPQLLKNANGDVRYFDKSIIGEYMSEYSANEFSQDLLDIVESWRTLPAMEVVNNIIDLHKALTRTLGRLKSSNQFIAFLNTTLGGEIAHMIKNIPIHLDIVLENDKLMKFMESSS